MRSALLLLSCAVTACLSQALFRHVLGGKIVWRGTLTLLIRDTLSVAANPLFLAGLASLAVSVILWFIVLATQKLSVAYPVQIGLVTLLTGVISVFVFREAIPLRCYLGYMLLLAGVVMIFR